MLTLERSRGRRAFTLIELIVVVIIIAVLAAIAGVAYNQFVTHARDTAVTADAKNVDTAITASSARSDQAPGEAVKLAIASGDFAGYFGIGGEGITFDVDSAIAPTVLQVAVGDRARCLNLGTEAGMSARISDGACSTSKTEPDLAAIVAGLVPGGSAEGGDNTPAPKSLAFDFTDAEGTELGAPWVPLTAGRTVIQGNQAYIGWGEHSFVVTDTGITDGTFQAKMSGAGPALAFRVQDKTNYFRAVVEDQQFRLLKMTDGATTTVASKYNEDISPYNATVKVVVAGDSIIATLNETFTLTATDSSFKNASRQGFLDTANSATTVDDFSAVG